MVRGLVLTVGALALMGRAFLADEPADPAPAMAKAADAFLAALDPAKRAQAAFPFNSAERLDWHFVPKDRQGVPLEQMSADERRAALALLRSGLSARGFTKVDTILHLEEVLFALEGSAMRDPGLYYFTVFGRPADQGAWGWRYEGHHVSLNWTVLDGRVVGSSPQFLGANPAVGLVVLRVAVDRVVPRLDRVAELVDGQLRGDLARGVSPHAVGDHEERKCLIDEEIILVRLSFLADVGGGPEG